ncbi:uncharacterized protein LOC141634008 isoform X2 [Silene latifolia]|uniref:uncharacterized protein LOC141634008 isoform X2 n=1 Tax=Silene latifolia TaxID=37657 RepID=UPI003D7863E7
MDFQNMKRRQLQSLCKLNNIPANLTNAAMATALSNLPTVEGLEEFLRDPTAGDFGSPEVPRTTTRQKVTIEEPEGSTLTTRTRGTRRQAVEGTGTRKTPATGPTRKKASEEATVQKQAKKDLQADFEADLEQSEVSDNSGLLGDDSMETSGDVLAVSVDNDAELSLESQNETDEVVQEVVNDVQEVFDVVDNNENLENNDDVSKDEEDPTEMYNSNCKVDFHSLSRRDLQGLCKKNKIPANTSNATMADALKSLEIVEGLEEFLEECNSQAPRSPTMSEMTSSCARRTWTSRSVSKEPASSKQITKSCRGSRRKVMEEIDQENASAVSQTSEAGTAACSVESVQKRELQTYSRRVTVASAAKPSENIECPRDVVSKEGSLSVVDAEENENPEVLDFVDTSNGYTLEAAAMNKFDESLQDVNTSEKDTEKGDYDILATENVKLLEDSENKKASDVDQISIGVSVIPEQLQNTVNDIAFSESKDSQLEDGTDASDEGFENKSENSELQNPNEGASAKSSEDSEVSTDAGSEDRSENSELQNPNEGASANSSEDSEVSTDAGSEDRSENNELQNVYEGSSTKTSEDSEVSSDSGSENGSENNDFENVDEDASTECSEDSEVSCDAGSENESENSEFENIDEGTNTRGLDKFEPELPTVADEVNNTETENQLVNSVVVSSDIAGQLCPVEQTENNHAEEENTSRNDALITHPNEKVEGNYAERDMSKEEYSESTIQTKGKKTPLEKKSMRQLKKLLKEKLQEPNALSKKLENLTLEDKDDSLAKVEEDRDDESEDLEGERAEDLEDLIESIDDGEDLQANFDANAVNLYPVDTILDNLISEDAVTGDINVEFNQELTSEKHSSNTPSKTMMPLVSSLSKTPVSVTKMNHASDVNKENIDHSASKTKSTKNSAARTENNILSPMSIRMLKKAIVGVQQQHSEKKRPALLPMSENCHPVASP